jgi:HK97 family phage prohead protease
MSQLTAAFAITAMADIQTRTISGVAVPFGVLGQTNMGPTIIDAGAVTPASRVVYLMSHDSDRPLGKMTAHEVTPDGIHASFKILATPAGDVALLEAAEGVRDGLSVGLDSIESYTDEAGVMHVTAAVWRETSQVTFPAFASARVTNVAASEPTAPDTEPVPETITESESTVTETPTVVEAAAPAYVPTFKVQDAFPYRASTRDDRGMQASFFRDMIHAKDDSDAAQRFTQATTMMTAANDMADVAEIIPQTYRPDLYVGQLGNLRTVIDSFSQFAIDGPNVQRVPTFATATGLMSDHVENTNPATGTFTTSEILVTPIAKSGTYSASREMIEGSTPAVDQLILNAIREEYALDTEAYAITTLLAGATAGTVVDISNGVTLQVLARMITFQANRKRGASVFLAGSDLFTELVVQVDGAARPMNPAVNAMNSTGTMDTAAMAVTVAGLRTPYVPVLTGGVLGVPSDFATFESGLRTWRWEEKSGPAKIELAAFGYIACAVLRPLGLLKFATQA